MKQAQLKITAHIHNIKLHVRFPCSVTATLRIQHEEVPYGQDVPLRLGEAIFDMPASQQCTVLYDPERDSFEQRKVAVLLYLKSSNGRIPAGSIPLTINEIRKEKYLQKYLIQKCPDKDASVQMSVSCECLNQMDCIPLIRSETQSQKGYNLTFRNNNLNSGKAQIFTKSHVDLNGPKSDRNMNGSNNVDKHLNHSTSRKGVEVTEDIYNVRSPGKTHTDHSAHQYKHQQQQYERELKNIQTKYQQQNIELKGTNVKKQILERTLKEVQGQLRIMRQRYSDLHIEYDNILKKNQFKDGSLRQQLKHLNQKYSHSEAETQRMIFQKNDLVNQFDERERNLRLGLREKEKSINEQKIKLSKKLEQMTALYNELRSHNVDNDAKQMQISKQLAKQKRRSQSLELSKDNLSHEIGLLKDQLASEKSQRRQLEETLSANSELQEQKKKFRRRIGELQQEIALQLKNYATAEANSQRYIRKSEELQESLKDKASTIKSMQNEIEGFHKQVECFRLALIDKDRKIDDLSSSKQKQSGKHDQALKQLNSNIQKLKEQISQGKRKMKQKDVTIANLKQEMGNSLDDISDVNKKNMVMELQLSEVTSELYKLKIKHEELLSEKERAIMEKTQLEVQLDSYIEQKDQVEKDLRTLTNSSEEEKFRFENQIKKLQYKIDNSNEESSFQIKQLQRRNKDLSKQIEQNSNQIEQLKEIIGNLEGDNSKGSSFRQQLQHEIKMKQKEVNFLNESLEKANQQITSYIGETKDLNNTIEGLRRDIQSLNEQLQFTNNQLNKANSSGSTTKQQLDLYKANNVEQLSLFFQTIQGGHIKVVPHHQEKKIVEMMQQTINRNNQKVDEYESTIQQLEEELSGEKISGQGLRQELARMQELQSSTSDDLQQTADQLSEEIKKNITINEHMKIVEQTYEKQRKDLMNNSSSQVEKLSQKLQILENKHADLQKRYEDQSQKSAQLGGSLSSANIQIQRMQADGERKRKQIETKATAIVEYKDLEKQLRDKLQEANNQIKSLKEVNENIRKRNQQGSSKQKQLEDQLNRLKEQYSVFHKKEEGAQNKLRTDLESSKTIIKAKEDQLRVLEHNIKTMRSEYTSSEKRLTQKEAILSEKVKELQVALDNEKRASAKQIQRLTKLSQGVERVKDELDKKITALGRIIEDKQKTSNLEGEYLQPIREHLSYLRGHMAEYSRVGDQFQSNKNKLLKMSHSRLQQFTDKNVGDKLREVSFVFQKLKSFLLSTVGLNEKQKQGVAQQLKKVQLSLDRSLRGDR